MDAPVLSGAVGDLMDVFAVIDACWPAAERWRAGSWTLRRGLGGGGRASAATLDGPMEPPDRAEAEMRAMGQRCLFMIRPGQEALDAALAERGYLVTDRVALLAAPVGELAGVETDWAMVRCDAPLARMVELWDEGGIGAARRAVMERVTGPRIYLLARDGDRPAGCAFVAAREKGAMLSALHVRETARRKGLGGRLTRAAARWAQAEGADTLLLAVSRANEAALAVYGGLGLTEVSGYHYRGAPLDPSDFQSNGPVR